MRLYNRDKREICAKKGEGIFIVKERVGKSMQIYLRTIKKGSRKIFNMVEGIYSGRGYLGKERKPKNNGKIR